MERRVLPSQVSSVVGAGLRGVERKLAEESLSDFRGLEVCLCSGDERTVCVPLSSVTALPVTLHFCESLLRTEREARSGAQPSSKELLAAQVR